MTLTVEPPGSSTEPLPVAAPRAARPDASVLAVGAAASITAGVIHAGAVAAHSEHRQAVWAFLATTVVQLAWGAAALARPRRWLAVAGAASGAAFFAGWAVAKSVGLPIDGLDGVEPVRWVDALAAGLAVVTLLACLTALLARRLSFARPVALVAVVALLGLSVPGAAAAVDHQHVHATSEPAAVVPPHAYDPTQPIDLSGVPGVTPEQQARAENLLSATILLLPQWADPAYDEAHGFFSIHDGATGTEHYLNPTFMADDSILDPTKPESLVFDTTVTPKKLVSAMYMLQPGKTLADVPDIGGALTQWHIHNNLCFDTKGHVRGLTNADGSCNAPLIKGPETPMIHVWIVPNRCGPFAALEGIGGGQVASGEAVACDHVHGG